jgi:hypothetical protein
VAFKFRDRYLVLLYVGHSIIPIAIQYLGCIKNKFPIKMKSNFQYLKFRHCFAALKDSLYGQIQRFYQENISNRQLHIHLTVHSSSNVVVAYEQVSASTTRRGAPHPLLALRLAQETLAAAMRNKIGRVEMGTRRRKHEREEPEARLLRCCCSSRGSALGASSSDAG